MKITIFVLTIVIQLLSNAALAKDFGKQGTTFEIKEEGFVSMMQRKLKDINLAEHKQKMQDLAKKRIEEPTAIPGITRATKTISHSFDPSYVLDRDVFLPCGKLLYARGHEVNPLDHMEWNGRIVFIDGRDQSQIAWVKDNYLKAILAKSEEESLKNLSSQNQGDTKIALTSGDTKIIFTGGRALELEREVSSPIYFDQFGELTTKFNIVHVPAIVQQEGKYLKVTEINISDGR